MKKKIGIIYSSFNNYSLLENEVLRRVNFCDYPVINIDDHSNLTNQKLGKKICEKNNITFEVNKGKGVQLAVNQGINFLSNKFNCEWVFCLQQDIFPLEENFFSEFEKKIVNKNLNNIGAIGFNILSRDKMYMNPSIVDKYLNGENVKGWMGVFILSDTKKEITKLPLKIFIRNYLIKILGNQKLKKRMLSANAKYRVFSPESFHKYDKTAKKYNGLFAVEIPMWGAVAINVEKWKKNILPSDDFVFHLWFPDIAFQFMKSGNWITSFTDLYLLNDQKSKEKHGFHWSSAHAGRDKNLRFQIEEYGDHLQKWKKKWGFDFENPMNDYSSIRERYKDTIIDKFYDHDCRDGPIKSFLL